MIMFNEQGQINLVNPEIHLDQDEIDILMTTGKVVVLANDGTKVLVKTMDDE